MFYLRMIRRFGCCRSWEGSRKLVVHILVASHGKHRAHNCDFWQCRAERCRRTFEEITEQTYMNIGKQVLMPVL